MAKKFLNWKLHSDPFTMKHAVWLITLAAMVWLGTNCAPKTIPEATIYNFPDPVDTEDHDISLQVRKQYDYGTIHATNKYPTARLNNFIQENDSVFHAIIEPENTPINHSPWYGFKIWSDTPDSIYIKLVYPTHRHRYVPKLSDDGLSWTPLAETEYRRVDDDVNLLMKLPVDRDTLWVSAQEIYDSRLNRQWAQELAMNENVTLGTYGQSRSGIELNYLDITRGKKKGKDVIVVLSRQHPPEVTGYLAMRVFVEEILENPRSAEFLGKYRVLVYPMLNPDGVDNGHWRHNFGGIDLNRDWAYYHQPETRQVANHLVAETFKNKNQVVLGLDFHSTQEDVFYTIPDEVQRYVIPGFKRAWLNGIESNIPNYSLNESPDPMSSPVTKFWFYTQFQAEGVTYEIGDETPRDFIRLKGRVSAQQMIKVLLDNEQ